MQVETMRVDDGPLLGESRFASEIYDWYKFSNSEIAYVARSYTHDPTAAAFLRRDPPGPFDRWTDQELSLCENDLTHPLFVKAVDYLRQIGKINLRWLNPDSTPAYKNLR